jgi:hypothetical protein
MHLERNGKRLPKRGESIKGQRMMMRWRENIGY